MKILAVEFSSSQRSVAVLNGRAVGVPIAEVVDTSPRGSEALGMVETALRQGQIEREQIECVAVGLGPGSYTGIRSAIALAQGWELAAGERDIKFIGLSSADCIAAEAQADGLKGSLAVVIDAQRNEFYLASYNMGARRFPTGRSPGAATLTEGTAATNPVASNSSLVAAPGDERPPLTIEPLRLASLADVQARAQAGETVVGPEVTKWFPAGRLIFPRAATLARLALNHTEFVPANKLQPIYLRETKFVKAPPARKLPT
jgi:tRNA threonylcarbamoyl adenosine modification protein YeaZ